MTADDVRDPEDNKVWIRFGYGLDMVWICKFGLAAGLSGSDMRIWIILTTIGLIIQRAPSLVFSIFASSLDSG